MTLRLAASGLFMAIVLSLGWPDLGMARRETLTADQKAQLKRAERTLVEALALTERGSTDPGGMAGIVTARLKDLGYTVVRDPEQPHDVIVKVKCEESKVWEGTTRSGGDADVPGAVSRLWKGPACQVSYRLDGKTIGWRHEVRTEFQDAREAARAAGAEDAGAYALAKLTDRLREDPFPFLLAAEWGQADRLLQVLRDPEMKPAQKVTVISLLGNMFAVEAMPQLTHSLTDSDPAVAKAAAVAIGTIGHRDGVPALLALLKTGSPDLRMAAVNGLGRIAPLHPEADIVPALLDALPGAAVTVQTEIVRALAKTQDRRTREPLQEFNRRMRTLSGPEVTPQVVELRRALGIALDQFDGAHSNE